MNNDEDFIFLKIHEHELLDIIKEVVSYYLFKGEQVLILSNNYKDCILSDNLFNEFDKRIINLESDYNIKELINYLLSNLNKQTGKTIISKVDLLYRSIYKKQELLNKISDFFNVSKEDIPINEKYIITDKKFDDNNPYNKYYRTYRIKKPFTNYNYLELKETCNKIIQSNLSTIYIKYRRILDNDIFKCIKCNLDYKLINDSIYTLQNIINNKEIDYKLVKSNYTNDFLDLYFTNQISGNDDILENTKAINKKYNYHLLNKSIEKKWFNVFKFKNKNREKENLNLFYDIQDQIYNEYVRNYNYIKNLKDKLSFLKEVLTEGEYDELLNEIIKNENLYENLTYYKKILEKVNDNKVNMNFINNISPCEEEVLRYCYDDLEEKKEINELVSIIPILKCYLDIEEEEFKYIDILNIYKEYDDIIVSIYDDNDKRSDLISNAIINVWDNKLRDRYSSLVDSLSDINNDSLNELFPFVIGKLSNENIKYLISNKFNFEKVIIISNDINEFVDFKMLGKSMIYVNISSDLISKKDIEEINSINLVSNEIFTEIKFNLLNIFNGMKISIKEEYMELKSNNNTILILLNNYEVNKDIFEYEYYKMNNIHVYRLWYRDWWTNKFKEIDKISKYIKEIDNSK